MMCSSNPMHSTQYVIIGNSAAGVSAAKAIRRYDPEGRITIVSDERALGYSRVMLPLYIAGKSSLRGMTIAEASLYSSLRIRLIREESVEAVDPKTQRVRMRSGAALAYDSLLIATGASPKRLEIPGKDLTGVHTLRNVTDARSIRTNLSENTGPALVLGGGLVGLKSVEALLARRRKVHWAISSDRILGQILDRSASAILLEAFRKKGVDVHLNADAAGFEGNGRVSSAALSDRKALPCSLVVIGKGVKPNTALCSGMGIAFNEGICVNDQMATNVASIYAAGDVAETFDAAQNRLSMNALWPVAVEGGRVAGSNMAGVPATFSRSIRMNSMEALGIRIVSVGDLEGDEEVNVLRKGGTIYRKLFFSEGRLKGFILVGAIQDAGILTAFVRNQSKIAFPILKEGVDLGWFRRQRFRASSGQIETRRI
jgi:nitrite reductase (NADH) large subunit